MTLLKFGWLTWQGWTEPVILPMPFILHIHLEILVHLNHDCSRRGASPVAQCKESTCWCRRCGLDPWVGKIPWRRKWQPTPVLLPRKSHIWRSLFQDTVHGVSKSRTQVSDFTFTFSFRRPRDLTGQGKTWILNARKHVCSLQCDQSHFSLNHLPLFTFIP